MKTELHLHTARYSGCALNGPREMMSRCVDCGYEAVYITEHDAVWAAREIDELQSQFPRIKIFSGVELTVGLRPLLHLLVLGTNDPAYLKFDRDLTAVIEKARHEGHLTILAHPCRWEDTQAVLDPECLPDALEHLTPNQDLPHQIRETRAAADRFQLPLVNSGDAHSLEFINRYWIRTHRPIRLADDIRQIVLEGAYENKVAGG